MKNDNYQAHPSDFFRISRNQFNIALEAAKNTVKHCLAIDGHPHNALAFAAVFWHMESGNPKRQKKIIRGIAPILGISSNELLKAVKSMNSLADQEMGVNHG